MTSFNPAEKAQQNNFYFQKRNNYQGKHRFSIDNNNQNNIANNYNRYQKQNLKGK